MYKMQRLKGINVVIYRFLKRIKKQLKKKRVWIGLAVWVCAILAALMWSQMRSNAVQDNVIPEDLEVFKPQSAVDIMNLIQGDGVDLEVTVHTEYICGEEWIQLGKQTPKQMQVLLEDTAIEELVMTSESALLIRKQVSDLSPECKANAYMGIDENGNLTLFDGLPGEDNVIRTFFQMDVKVLESSVPKETFDKLQQGIRITDLAEYNSVLSTFSEFALEDTEQVMSTP